MRKNAKLWFVISTVITIIIIALLSINITLIIKEDSSDLTSADVSIIILFGITIVVSLFVYSIMSIVWYRTRTDRTNSMINSINTIESTQEEIFEVGIIVFDDNQKITFITPWLLEEGFNKYLGKKVSKLDIEIESNKTQNLYYNSRYWDVVVSRKNKTLLLKDVTYTNSLKQVISYQRKAILTINTNFSRKINFNDSVKSNINTNIGQELKKWSEKIGGIYDSSVGADGTSSVVFNWLKGSKTVLNESLLKSIKHSIGKNINDTTISIGISYGGDDFSILLDKSLKALEISKNRGGGQIVIDKPDGEILYIGVSSSQAVSNNTLNIRRFYASFISDISKAREIFITSHDFSDLDSIGSSLGIYELIKDLNKNIYIVIETMDNTAEKLFNSLPKYQKDLFVSVKQANTLLTNRSHIVITDISNIEQIQGKNLVKKTLTDKVTVIDHHRLNKDTYQYVENNILIETSISSTSEIVVEMLKIKYGVEAQDAIEQNISTALYAGIQLDSKKMTQNVSNNTFDAISFLINNDANIEKINHFFKAPQKLIEVQADAYKNINKLQKDVVFTFVSENITVSDETSSILANNLLEFENIEAAFVLVKTKNNKFKLSARSNGTYNVQNIAENLGGGGHFSTSAANWSTNIKYSTIRKRIITEINRGVK